MAQTVVSSCAYLGCFGNTWVWWSRGPWKVKNIPNRFPKWIQMVDWPIGNYSFKKNVFFSKKQKCWFCKGQFALYIWNRTDWHCSLLPGRWCCQDALFSNQTPDWCSTWSRRVTSGISGWLAQVRDTQFQLFDSARHAFWFYHVLPCAAILIVLPSSPRLRHVSMHMAVGHPPSLMNLKKKWLEKLVGSSATQIMGINTCDTHIR